MPGYRKRGFDIESLLGPNDISVITVYIVNPLPNNKILDVTKLKAFADDKLNIDEMMISLFDRVETLREKEEMLITSIFSFSHSVFQRLCGKDLNCCNSVYVCVLLMDTLQFSSDLFQIDTRVAFSHSRCRVVFFKRNGLQIQSLIAG